MSVTIEPIGISIIAVIISGASFLFAYVKGVKEQEQRWSELDKRLSKLETKMELFWNYVDDNMGKIIHSPHTPEVDALLEKMPKVTLFEAEKLKCLLIPDWEKERDPVKKKVYGWYLARIESLIIDKKDEK